MIASPLPTMTTSWSPNSYALSWPLLTSKSTIESRFPSLLIEPNFEEHDIYWKADDRETNESMQTRGRRALDRVFDTTSGEGATESFISITSHSEFFRNLLAVLNHQPYPLSTGEMIPVFVKATRVDSANGESSASGRS
jgi:hypothetical protein